jgi:hypothetical protein
MHNVMNHDVEQWTTPWPYAWPSRKIGPAHANILSKCLGHSSPQLQLASLE